MRGLFGREQAGQNSQAALPPAIDQSAVNVSFERAWIFGRMQESLSVF